MDWTEAHERLQAPIFAPLHAPIARLPRDHWPTHGDLDAIAGDAATLAGLRVRFVPPRERSGADRRSYERRIFETGEVETRGNWHDLFNALAWIAFPRTKAAINAQHAAILVERAEEEARRRGPERDALTLFDEGGVAVACNEPEVPAKVRDHDWKGLFWDERARLLASARFFAFGHALFEKALDPYLGIVAKTVFVPHSEGFLARDCAAQVREVDARLAAHFRDRAAFASPRSMPPLPVFGIPGWHPRTADESFYADEAYFRPKGGSRRSRTDPQGSRRM